MPSFVRPAGRTDERNQGAVGVDGVATGQLRGHLRQQWEQIKEQLLAGTYMQIEGIAGPATPGTQKRLRPE
jgi:hypothetical protein